MNSVCYFRDRWYNYKHENKTLRTAYGDRVGDAIEYCDNDGPYLQRGSYQYGSFPAGTLDKICFPSYFIARDFWLCVMDLVK